MSQFPNLLRRSSFATHDPLITRIYTSTPSSVSKYGDWGLKYPIHRAKGPRYIRFSNFDAGAAIGADWQSGEREARFMQQWGTGRVAWSAGESSGLGLGNGARQKRNSILDGHADTAGSLQGEEQQAKPVYVPAIESMSEREFERYLEKVRAQKNEALQRKLDGHREMIEKAKYKASEGQQTMVSLAISGHHNDTDGADEMGRMNTARISSPQSSVLVSRPHALGGIAYSTPSPSSVRLPADHVHPSTSMPGRALQQYNTPRHSTRASTANLNAPWVVGVGGLTGTTMHNVQDGTIHDEPQLNGTDWSRADPASGRASFRIHSANIKGDPTVLNLRNQDLRTKYDVPSGLNRAPDSRAIKPRPMKTFQHSITFDVDVSEAATQDAPYIPLGSAAYVGRSQPKPVSSRSDNMARPAGLAGGPKAGRPRGETLFRMQQQERRAEQMARTGQRATVEAMMAKIAAAATGAAGAGDVSAQRPGQDLVRRGGAGAGAGAGQSRPSFRDARRSSSRR